MPNFSQRDVFAAIADRSADLAIIFGHIGFNSMRASWRSFSDSIPSLANVRDPFSELSGKALPIYEGQWLWFVAEHENHGMPDAALASNLNSALSWASTNGVRTVITNGLADTNHGSDAVLNRVSDDRRARFLIEYAAEQERARGLTIELTSLNSVFVRNVDQDVPGQISR